MKEKPSICILFKLGDAGFAWTVCAFGEVVWDDSGDPKAYISNGAWPSSAGVAMLGSSGSQRVRSDGCWREACDRVFTVMAMRASEREKGRERAEECEYRGGGAAVAGEARSSSASIDPHTTTPVSAGALSPPPWKVTL